MVSPALESGESEEETMWSWNESRTQRAPAPSRTRQTFHSEKRTIQFMKWELLL